MKSNEATTAYTVPTSGKWRGGCKSLWGPWWREPRAEHQRCPPRGGIGRKV